jgi:hypothetical protein
MKRSIYCLAKNNDQANRIIQDLHGARISDDSISVLYADKKAGGVHQVTPSSLQREMRHARRTGSEDREESTASPKSNIGFEKGTKSAEGALTGATAGGVIGGTLGLLAGLGTIALPGVGTLLAAGPIFAALSGVAVGSISGGIAGSLTAAQIPEYYVSQASQGIREGQILIAVEVDSKEDAKKISTIFENDGASDVSITKAS